MASRPIPIMLGEVVDIVIQNRAAYNGICEMHPWHMHGNRFWLIGLGSGAYIENRDRPMFNTNNPLVVDTAVLYPSFHGRQRYQTFQATTKFTPCGWMALRVHFNNPGFWLFHCHILSHTILGMEVVFDVSSTSLWAPPYDFKLPSDYGTCGQSINEASTSNKRGGITAVELRIVIVLLITIVSCAAISAVCICKRRKLRQFVHERYLDIFPYRSSDEKQSHNELQPQLVIIPAKSDAS